MKTLHLGGLGLLLLSSPALAQWTETTPATSPAGRGAHGMTYDPTTATVLVFGGDTFGFPAGATNETWRYDGAAWTLLTPPNSPPATVGAQLVYDLNRGVFVTYGSVSTSFFGGPSEDRTWEFDGATWTEVFPVNTPGGLGHYGMAYDSTRNVTVLYGGLPDNFFPIDSDKTWEYDGIDWTEVTPANNPGPLERPAMCFHSGLGVTVLFGGIDVQTGGNDDVWLYDGTNWTVAAITGPRPAVRTGCRMVFDSLRQVCVMTGGQDPTNGTPYNDTWELDLLTMTWSQAMTSYTDARLDAGLAFDVARRQVVQFGGINFQTFVAYGDTWEYGARSRTFGVGCAGSNGVPALDANDAPRFGTSYVLTVSGLNTTNNTGVLALSLNDIPATPLDVIGMPGCTGYVPADVLATVSGAAGSAAYTLAVPTAPILMGTSVFSQALTFEPNLNPLWLAATNAHQGTVGN